MPAYQAKCPFDLVFGADLSGTQVFSHMAHKIR